MAGAAILSESLSRGQRLAANFLCGVALCVPVVLGGCSSGGGLTPPSISPQGVAEKAIKQYDKNGDGALDAAELEHCPALKGLLKPSEGKVTAEQIAGRLTKMVDGNVARISVSCKVLLDGQPLENATVRLVPESFMGSGFEPAVGVTDRSGNALLKSEDGATDGAQWGFYRVEVSKKNSAGKETLPARYNTSTNLGCEVAPDRRGSPVFRLQGS
jgi:hypothetical protein